MANNQIHNYIANYINNVVANQLSPMKYFIFHKTIFEFFHM